MKKKISNPESPIQQTRFFDFLEGKPFWIWDIQRHKQEDKKTNGLCCFNHIIGLPVKDNEEKPLFDYEKLIFEFLEDHKHLCIKKASTPIDSPVFDLTFINFIVSITIDYYNIPNQS